MQVIPFLMQILCSGEEEVELQRLVLQTALFVAVARMPILYKRTSRSHDTLSASCNVCPS